MNRHSRRSGLHGGGDRLFAVLALVLAESLCASLCPPVQDGFPVLVHLQLDDGDLAGVDANVSGGAVGLLPLDTLNVDPRKVDYTPILIETDDSPELGPVALEDLANLLALVVTSHHLQAENRVITIYILYREI